MADFEAAFQALIRREGGFSESDALAGAVKYGITQAFLKTIRGRDVSVDEVRNLTLEEARKIYRQYFWDPLALNSVPNQRLAEVLFDISANMGASVRVIARGISSFCQIVGLQPIVGTPTRQAIVMWLGRNGKALSADRVNLLVDCLLASRLHEYSELVFARPKVYARYIRGWTARALSL